MNKTPNEFDLAMMNRATRLACRGAGYVAPNPAVGCVIVDPSTGHILGEGWHTRCGQPHAEVEALADCENKGNAPSGATVYVTLEPCNHYGRTPPCAEALMRAGVKRVVYGRTDPSPESGGGTGHLTPAGIAVELLETPETLRISEPFAKRITQGLPFVTLKWAQTVDGVIATRTGHSQWISNARARHAVHRIRARVCAILTGIGTVIADDPLLTARNVRRIRRVAQRVVVDPNLDIPLECQLVQTAGDYPTIVGTTTQAAHAKESHRRQLEAAGVAVLTPTCDDGETFERVLLKMLVQEFETTNVFVEAGGGLMGKLLKDDLVDEVLIHVAPIIMGDEQARGPVRGMEPARIEDGHALTFLGTRQLGDNVEWHYSTQG